ncbi:MAG TPA: RHS repeat-associated core domain-containing protein [Acidobacteriaceae bacterium]|jgi:RHS repeat-associated protein
MSSYVRTTIAASASHTEITDGAGNVSEYDFMLPSNVPNAQSAQLYPTQVTAYQGAATGTPLLSDIICYNTGPCPSSISLPITGVYVTEKLNGLPSTQGGQTFSSYTGATLTSAIGDSSGAPFPEAVMIEQITPGGLVLPGLNRVLVTDSMGHNQTISETDYSYDESAPTGSTGVPMHVAATGDRGNLTSVTQYVSGSSTLHTTMTYEDTGSLLSRNDPTNGVTNYSYDPSFVYQTSAVPPLSPAGVSLPSSAGFDMVHTGAPTSVSDPNATTTIPFHDAFLRPTEIDYPDGGKTTFTYSPSSMGQHRTMSAGTDDQETILDAYGRLSRTAVANGQSPLGWYVQDTCYDAVGLLGFQSTPYQASNLTGAPVCTGAGTTYTYDALGRPLTTQRAGSSTTASTSYWGRTVETMDENGVTKLTKIDALGRISAVCEVTTVTLPNSGAPVSCGMDIAGTGYLTTYAYDLLNHTTTITQGAQQRVFQTDWLGRTTSVQEPESGLTTYTYGSNATGATVTRVKARANQSNPTVTTTAITQYDHLNRILSISYNDGTATKTYTYDQAVSSAGGGVSLGASKGRLTSFSTGSTQGFYGYDPMGRIATMMNCQPVNCAGGTYLTQSYQYDGVGNLLSASDGAGRTLGYGYTLASEPSTATSTPTVGGATPLVTGAQYGPFGPQSISLGNGLTRLNSYATSGYLNGGWVCQGGTIPSCAGGTQVYGMSLVASGNRIATVWDTVLNQGMNFGYDDMNRLSSRTTIGGAAQSFTYSYDRWGNRNSQIAMNYGPSMTTTFNTTTNQIHDANGALYTYDAAGNVWSDGTYSYNHDAEGNVVGVSGGTSATYVYDALNQRVETATSSGVQQFTFNRDGQRLLTLDGTGNVSSEASFFAGERTAFYNAGAFHFEHRDWLGTERMRTGQTGMVEGAFGSLPFGDGYVATGSDQDPNHFTGLDRDTETGNYHAAFRDYSPANGTWLQPDPYSGSYDFSNPQSLNRFVYTRNNPMFYRDPSGLMIIRVCQNFNDSVTVEGYTADKVEQFSECEDFDDGEVEDRYIPYGGDSAGTPKACAGRSFPLTADVRLQANANGVFTAIGINLGPTASSATVAGNGIYIQPGTMLGVGSDAVGSVSIRLTQPISISPVGKLGRAYISSVTFNGGQFTQVDGARALFGIALGSPFTPSDALKSLLNQNSSAAAAMQSLANTVNTMQRLINCSVLTGG